LGELHRGIAGLSLRSPVPGGHAARGHPRGVMDKKERGSVPHQLHNGDPPTKGPDRRGHAAPRERCAGGHRIFPAVCQAVRSARVFLTPSVTEWELMVAPEMLRMSWPTTRGAAV